MMPVSLNLANISKNTNFKFKSLIFITICKIFYIYYKLIISIGNYIYIRNFYSIILIFVKLQ